MFRSFVLVLSIVCLMMGHGHSEEGMYPISELSELNLKARGLKMDTEAIFSTDEASLVDAIVNLSGCTGSFISEDGLILTNHHCAYRAVQNASTTENDYLKNGFYAKDRSEEAPAEGYTVRITKSYRDVSDEVLRAVDDTMNAAQRRKAIDRKMKEIELQAEEEHEGARAEVSEMFIGKTYVLFLYTYLKDVRLVYAPPKSIGNFGGDVDNWEWPRHTGDFALMRAYAKRDGSPAEYDEENVPYTPKKFLTVDSDGVSEGDYVFLLGYPARTYRHRSSHFLKFQYKVRMPWIKEWYQWQIDLMSEMSRKNPEASLKLSSRIKSLANVEKNYRGKIKGVENIALLEQKKEQEQRLQAFIEQDKNRANKYGSVLSEVDAIYETRSKRASREFILDFLPYNVNMFYVARRIVKAAEERQKEDVERESAYMDRNFDRTKQYVRLRLKNHYAPADRRILRQLLQKAAKLPDTLTIDPLRETFALNDTDKLEQKLKEAYDQTRLDEPDYVMEAMGKTPQEVQEMVDPFIRWMLALKPVYDAQEERDKSRSGKLTELSAKLVDVKKQFLKEEFVPDANGTLRFTHGFIKGYAPADAVWMQPITTLKGIIEKYEPEPPFDAPKQIRTLYREKRFGDYAKTKAEGVPVCILYSMDTSGGNSGSPVFNAEGQLVGLNFDRTFEATINDFAWNESYSRSIGVDMRYVLWLLDVYAGADRLLQEISLDE